eukprot:gene7885-9053_t
MVWFYRAALDPAALVAAPETLTSPLPGTPPARAAVARDTQHGAVFTDGSVEWDIGDDGYAVPRAREQRSPPVPQPAAARGGGGADGATAEQAAELAPRPEAALTADVLRAVQGLDEQVAALRADAGGVAERLQQLEGVKR